MVRIGEDVSKRLAIVPALIAHTLVSRFVDHMPYYRQEAINVRSGVHIPRSALAAWSGAAGAGLEPLFEVHKAFVWGCARGEFDALPGAVYDVCLGRGSKHPVEFLKGWNGTLVCDDYRGMRRP